MAAFGAVRSTLPGQQARAPAEGPAIGGRDCGFEGWFASSQDMRRGLQVQPLRIDPQDPLWHELFRPA